MVGAARTFSLPHASSIDATCAPCDPSSVPEVVSNKVSRPMTWLTICNSTVDCARSIARLDVANGSLPKVFRDMKEIAPCALSCVRMLVVVLRCELKIETSMKRINVSIVRGNNLEQQQGRSGSGSRKCYIQSCAHINIYHILKVHRVSKHCLTGCHIYIVNR